MRLFLVSPAVAIRRGLAKALDAEPGIVVIGEARTSAQALSRVPAARPDVVLSGAHLTDPDSAELCRRLRATMPEVQVLMVGVNAPLPLIDAAVRAGAAGVVPHTADEPDLVRAIVTAASGGTVMSTDTLGTILRGESPAVQPDPLAGLSGLERELFYLIGEGLTNAEIAKRLSLAPSTVRNYASRLFRKLGVERRAQVVALAARRPSRPAEQDARPVRYAPRP